MNIGNGFLVGTEQEAINKMEELSGRCVRCIPLTGVPDTMKYYTTTDAHIFSCKRYKDFLLLKERQFDQRAIFKGPTFRAHISGNRYETILVAAAVWATYRDGTFNEHLIFSYKDGNPFNPSLENIEIAKYEYPTCYKENINRYQDVYSCEYSSIVKFLTFFRAISLEDSKDIVSDTFFELCMTDKRNIDFLFFRNIWRKRCLLRCLDAKKNILYNHDSLLYEDGEEVFGTIPKDIETDDIWGIVSGDKSLQYLKMWCQGLNPIDISEVTGSSQSSVSSSIYRSIQKLRRKLENDIVEWRKK